VGETTWPSQVLGPRWEAVARAHLSRGGVERLGPLDAVGATTVSDRAGRRSHEVDLLAMRDGRIAAVGEAKLRALGAADLDRLLRIRDLLGAPDAAVVLASATGVEPTIAGQPDAVAVKPADLYGMA
jgi:hypothetical protein